MPYQLALFFIFRSILEKEPDSLIQAREMMTLKKDYHEKDEEGIACSFIVSLHMTRFLYTLITVTIYYQNSTYMHFGVSISISMKGIM
jgi:hypothetical protein